MLDKKQYLITKSDFSHENFDFIQLKNGYKLYYEKSLKVEKTESEKECVIIGMAFQSDSRKPSPYEQIKEYIDDKEKLLSAKSFWGGKYILIYDGIIYLDACATKACYYTSRGNYSSSVHLLSEIEKFDIKEPKLVNGCGIDFYLAPCTPYENVYKLLPSQCINIYDGSIDTVELLPNINKYKEMSKEELADEFARYSTALFKNMAKEYDGGIYLALTGGYDSRTTLALLHSSKIPFKTFIVKSKGIDKNDCLVSKKLSDVLNVEHILRSKGKKDKEKIKEYRLHTYGMAVGYDETFYAKNLYPHNEKGENLILRSSVYEICISYYNWLNEIKDVNKHFYNSGEAIFQNSLKLYEEVLKNDEKNKNINLKTRYFWEQREGAWLSALEQSLDILDNSDSIQAINCTELICILMCFDESLRKGKKYQEFIISRLCPEISNISYANEKAKKFRTFKRIKLLASNMKEISKVSGLKEALSYFRFKIKNHT